MPLTSAASTETSRCNPAVPGRLVRPLTQLLAAAASLLGFRRGMPPVRVITTCETVIYGIGGFAGAGGFSLRTF